MNFMDFMDSFTIQNDNRGLEHLLPLGSLLLPDLGAMAFKYKKKIKVSRNRYYNFKNHAQRIKEMHGIEIFRRRFI